MKYIGIYLIICHFFVSAAQEGFGAEFDKRVDLQVQVLADGIPLEGATVKGGFKRRMGDDEPVINYIATDTNGLVQASAVTSGQVTIKVTKDGYYQHYESLNLYNLLLSGPVFTNLTVDLKKIVNPIPMYANEVRTYIPQTNCAVGYDICTGDWIEPFGNGKKADLMFEMQYDFVDDQNYEVTLLASFPNPHDGIQPFDFKYPKHEGPELKSAYEAPVSGYASSLVMRRICKDGLVAVPKSVGGYYFRLNTVVDNQGELISAQYGKIYGDIVFDRFASLLFRYYFNPDKTRNVEFDPKRNLFLKQPDGGFLPQGRAKLEYSITAP